MKKMTVNPVEKFSKLAKDEKIAWLAMHYFKDSRQGIQLLQTYWNNDEKLQKLHDEFIENTLSNFYMPFGIAPNFLINNHLYAVPMVIEESSVVAAAARSAKFWLPRGGFKAEVLSMVKNGQVHFMYHGDAEKLFQFFEQVKPKLISDVEPLTQKMKKRGGGVLDVVLVDKTSDLEDYFQLSATFDTCDAMGANFINSCLEQFAKTFRESARSFDLFTEAERDVQIVMSILSNYAPECLVRAEVSCPVSALNEEEALLPQEYARKFLRAVRIAEVAPNRAVTHNKGIMNGVDALVLATGNDFRAIEACVHAFAARDGHYKSLTHAAIEGEIFRFWIEIPLALGTVGGLTQLHPLVKLAHEILGNPSAEKLMELAAVAGLAQNFAAINALITSGIQKGHMKMHLLNILNQFNANEAEKGQMIDYFKNHTVTFAAVEEQLAQVRVTNILKIN
ncbi:MAG: hydroxymethylglutaryl-CoA reductase, degradative [Flavobacteriales bacterium CG_4_9_14_3_um_filter_40_17]|nr:MAG: hydroxymethylglutaryl-CoA reductase, degradative [Flavobacteriales bacterium CG_4_9_14_3_um_filter_40_17]